MEKTTLIAQETTGAILGAFFHVYNILGYGFLEAVYVAALEQELRERGHRVGREVHVPVEYRGVEIGRQRLDMVVDAQVVVEVKSTEALHPNAKRQLLSYLRATHLEVGLVLHFGPKPRFQRVVCLNDPGTPRPPAKSV